MKKILVIEDDSSVRDNIEILLEESGYRVLSAEDGKQGVKLAKEFLPDLILSDIMMPYMDGYKVIKKLSSDTRTLAIPFIFLTAKAEMSDLRFGMQLGADDYLLKPFNAAELLKTIEIRLNKKEQIIKNELSSSVIGPIEEEKSREKKKLEYNSHLFLLTGDRPEIVKVSAIKYILAESEYSRVFTSDGKKHYVRRLLKIWEEILPSDEFLRIHRSTIINLEYIRSMEKWFNNSFRVFLTGVDEPFIISRRFSAKLRSQLNL